jgi:DNA-binding response OmpR family regulator
MSIEAYEVEQFATHVGISSEHINKKYKVLLISQNSTDIFLVNKLLNDLGNFKVYEAGNLNAAMKVVSYLTLDLIIVDDRLPKLSGYEIINRLNRNQLLKYVPKVMLLTKDYKESQFGNANFDNLDFIKKPIDKMIFKTRIHSILKNQQDKFKSGSIFENMIDAKISEAKEFLKIYKSFLDIDQNILFVYDKKSNQIVESNKNFSKFFGENRLFNRIISNPRLMQKFVPTSLDPNYLNAHHISTWLNLMTSTSDFNFLLTLKNRSKEYTFNVLLNKMKLFKKEIYIVKLSNYNIPVATKSEIKFQNHKVNSALVSLHNSLNKLDNLDQRDIIREDIKNVLDALKISSSHFEDQSEHDSNDVNVYFIIAKILKEKLHKNIQVTLNSELITDELKYDHQIIYAKVSADALHDVVKGILGSYLDTQEMRVDVKVFELENNLKIEIITTDKKRDNSKSVLVNKLFKKDSIKEEKMMQTTTKQVQNALTILNADIKTYFTNGQNIFLISIPL